MQNHRRYFARGFFRPLPLALNAELSAPISANTRPVAPAEMWFCIGDELLRIRRFDAAGAKTARRSAVAEICELLTQPISLMPDFAPAQELLEFFEMLQGDKLPAARQTLQLLLLQNVDADVRTEARAILNCRSLK
jgi:hypothetical protein